jgi:asparagine synthase (glutamine-hydrolysing)
MSGFIGIFNADEAPVNRQLLERLTGSLTFRGPDAQSVWCKGGVGFGHTLFRTTWESAHERQPLTLDQQVWIVADARVDAREDLVRELGCEHDLALNQTQDVELILRAYLKWGEACLDYMIGDFSFTIWDGRSRKLFCARDRFGVKLFYYARTSSCLVFSNTITALRLHPEVSSRLNEFAIGDFLLFDSNWTLDTTFFTDIQKLPAGHQFTLTATHFERRKYWQLVEPETVRFKNEEDYIEGFRERLDEAVSDRMRTDKVAISLSGGLDSTNMTLASRRVTQRKGIHIKFKGFTTVWDSLIPDNERYYSGVAARALKMPVEHLAQDAHRPYDGWECRFPQPEPSHDPLYLWETDFYRHCANFSRVLLYGEGADEVLASFKLVTLLRHDPSLQTLVDVCNSIFRHNVFPAVGTGLFALWKSRRRTGEVPEPEPQLPKWLSKDFVARLSLTERWRIRDHRIGSAISGETSNDPLDVLATGSKVRFITPLWENVLTKCDMGFYGFPTEVRLPYLDLRVVLFGLGVPNIPWTQDKYLLRRLGRRTLPDEIISRPKTPLRGDPYAQGLRQNKELLSNLSGVSLSPILEDIVDIEEWRKSLRETSFETWPLWESLRVVSLNYWLQRDSLSKT